MTHHLISLDFYSILIGLVFDVVGFVLGVVLLCLLGHLRFGWRFLI